MLTKLVEKDIFSNSDDFSKEILTYYPVIFRIAQSLTKHTRNLHESMELQEVV